MGVRNWGCWGKSSIFSLFPPMSAFPPPSPPPRPCGPFLSSSPSSSSCCQTISALLSLLWAGRSRGGVRVQSPPPLRIPRAVLWGSAPPRGCIVPRFAHSGGFWGLRGSPLPTLRPPPLISRGIFGLDEDQTPPGAKQECSPAVNRPPFGSQTALCREGGAAPPHPPPLSLSLDIYFCICIFLYRKL